MGQALIFRLALTTPLRKSSWTSFIRIPLQFLSSPVSKSIFVVYQSLTCRNTVCSPCTLNTWWDFKGRE